MEDIIICDLNSTLTVIIEDGDSRMRNAHVRKGPMKPYKLLSSIIKSTILSLNTRTSNKSLLLAMPDNKRVTQEKTEPGSGTTISRIPYPACNCREECAK